MSASPKGGRLEASLCESCFEVFFSKKLFDAHKQKCSEPRSHISPNARQMGSSTLSKCATCRRIFLGGQNLAKHVKKEHNTSKIAIACYECKKVFMDVEKLAMHREQEHSSATSSAHAVKAAAEPKREGSSRSVPKVVTISQPKLVSKGDGVPKPNVKASEDETSPKPCPKPEADPKSKSEQGAKAVTMPVPDVRLDESEPPDDLMEYQKPEIMETAPDVTTSADSPFPGAEDSMLPTKPANVTHQTTDADASSAQTSTEQDDVSDSQSTDATATPTREPAAVSAVPPVSSVGSAVSTAVTTATAAATTSAAASASTAPSLFFACSSCNFMFQDKNMMLKHLAEKHGREATPVAKQKPPPKKPATRDVTIYACGICDKKYQSMKSMKAHIEAMHRTPREATAAREMEARRDTVWSTQECLTCSSLFQPSERLRDIYMTLSEWTTHFYGRHGTTHKLPTGKRLELHPCHRCGLVFVNNATRMHHNAISHSGYDPEAEMKEKQLAENRDLAGPASAQITPKSMSKKARSRVIVDSLMKASLVSRSSPTVTMDKASKGRAQSKVFAARTGSGQRATSVIFKCSKCGGMFPDDPSFERHAREVHNAYGDDAPSPRPVPTDPPPSATEVEQWDVLDQRECSECSKLMESCPRSFALFVRRDVWERHVNEVHRTMRRRCTGDRLQLHPCSKCPRLFLHPNTLEAHETKLHDRMLGPVTQADVDDCSSTNTLECSLCVQLVQNADGLRFIDGDAWNKHLEKEHKELLLCDGKAGEWQLYPCAKCQRLFFSERDIPTHEARQAYMHMPTPVNAKVVTDPKRDQRATQQETTILYQCANDNCSFTSEEHDTMVTHFQQCREAVPTRVGETVLYKTVMVRKPPPKPKPRRNYRDPNRVTLVQRLENVIQKLKPGSGTDNGGTNRTGDSTADGPPSEAATAVSQLLRAEPEISATPAVLELDPVTCQPRSSHLLQAAEEVPEAAAEEETVAAEEPQSESFAATSDTSAVCPTRMDFACSVCKIRGTTKEEIAAHIRREHKRTDGTLGPSSKQGLERQHPVHNYKATYLCEECKRMAVPCPRTDDLYFAKDTWLLHLSTTHKPTSVSALDRLDLHECGECEKLFLSHASLKRHSRHYHEPGAENLEPLHQQNTKRPKKHQFSCVEEGCTFKYHRVTGLRTHLINTHNFDLAIRELEFNNEDDFQEWKKLLEQNTNAYFVLRSNVQSKRKNGPFNVRYFGCSRVMCSLPTYKENGKKRSKPWNREYLKEDMVWRCPAFLKAEVAVNSTSINVSFCPNHYGHDMDPSFGRLSDADETEIAGLLRAGLSIPDVIKRMREEGRRESTPSRKQRVTEAEINIIYEKYMGTRPPKLKRYDPVDEKEVSQVSRVAATPVIDWNADLVAYDAGVLEAEDTAGDELSMEDTEAADDGMASRDSWQRVCGEEGCNFTTTSVGYLRSHLRQRHGFAMHIDTAGFASMKDFTNWKRSLEKRTCAKYTCYKSVAPSDFSDPVVTRYYTCHRSGLNSLKRTSGHAPPPRKLVLCTGYMKVRCDSSTGEVSCEYCASHYGHDARLTDRRVAESRVNVDVVPIEYETVEDTGEAASMPVVTDFTSPVTQFSPTAARYSFIQEEVISDQDVEVEVEEEAPPLRRSRVRPPKRRPAAPRRSRGGKRRRWEEVEEEEEEEEEQQFEDDSFESD